MYLIELEWNLHDDCLFQSGEGSGGAEKKKKKKEEDAMVAASVKTPNLHFCFQYGCPILLRHWLYYV